MLSVGGNRKHNSYMQPGRLDYPLIYVVCPGNTILRKEKKDSGWMFYYNTMGDLHIQRKAIFVQHLSLC